MGGDHLADGAMLLDDAKRVRVMVVCQWFTETVARGATVYVLGGVIHPVQYSAWRILGEAPRFRGQRNTDPPLRR